MSSDKKAACKYGGKCYRKSKDHLDKFSHPTIDGEDEVETTENLSRERSPELDQNEIQEPSAKKARVATDEVKTTTTDGIVSPVKATIAKLDTMEDKKKFILEKFLVTMPPDFYDLWELATSMNPEKPKDAFCVESLDLTLTGAFDVLGEEVGEGSSDSQFLIHARFPLDLPEFQTLIVGPEKHYGYLRDDPKSPEEWVTASNSNSLKPGTWSHISLIGDNLFSLLGNVIIEFLKKNKSSKVESVLKKLQSVANEKKYSMQPVSEKVKNRKKKVVAKSLHGGGIVVPMKGEVGYRELPESDSDLRKLLAGISASKDGDMTRKKMEKIEEMITYIQFANDECDYGMGLELGIDLFSSGHEGFHAEIQQLLPVAYLLLRRREWTKVLEAHLPVRWSRPLSQILSLQHDKESSE